MVIDLGKSVRERARNNIENVLVATFRLLGGNPRRYGGQIVHLGMFMIVAGVAGSSLFSVKQDMQMTPGETVQMGRYAIKFNSIDEVRGENYTAVQLTLELTDPNGVVQVLHPQKRFYAKSEQPNTEVAIRSSLREDFYATVAGWDQDGKRVAVQAIINPLVNWIWIGGIAFGVGGIVCLLPRFTRTAFLIQPFAELVKPATLPRRKGPAGKTGI